MFELSISPEVALTLEQAFQAHHQFRSRLQEAVDVGTTLDVEAIRNAHVCELGQWLQGEGAKRYGQIAAFGQLVRVHSEFHYAASVVAQFINRKRYEQAHQLLESRSLFSIASTDLGIAILRLRAALARPVPDK